MSIRTLPTTLVALFLANSLLACRTHRHHTRKGPDSVCPPDAHAAGADCVADKPLVVQGAPSASVRLNSHDNLCEGFGFTPHLFGLSTKPLAHWNTLLVGESELCDQISSILTDAQLRGEMLWLGEGRKELQVPPGQYFVTVETHSQVEVRTLWLEPQARYDLSLNDLAEPDGHCPTVAIYEPKTASFQTPFEILTFGAHQQEFVRSFPIAHERIELRIAQQVSQTSRIDQLVLEDRAHHRFYLPEEGEDHSVLASIDDHALRLSANTETRLHFRIAGAKDGIVQGLRLLVAGTPSNERK